MLPVTVSPATLLGSTWAVLASGRHQFQQLPCLFSPPPKPQPHEEQLPPPQVPLEMSMFAGITHLNLSSSRFGGSVPNENSHMSKLVSIDLSRNSLVMLDPTMRMIVANLTKLEELDLSYTNMAAVIRTSLMNFSAYLTSLSFQNCLLRGDFLATSSSYRSFLGWTYPGIP